MTMLEFLDWSSPIGLAAFFAGIGVFFMGIGVMSKNSKGWKDKQ